MTRGAATDTLALLGGTPVRRAPFPAYRVIGAEEKVAVGEVLDSGVLSGFYGSRHLGFHGGPAIRRFEDAWAGRFAVRHAISVNSCTSGLAAAVGAVGVGPGDEVIVSPYTMSASVTAAVVFNAVPVFADIDPATYCLSPASIRERLSPRTRAIIVVDLFGQAAAMEEIMAIAAEGGITVIEDAAQAPFAERNGKAAGTLGHLGVFSLNYHKHIHTGEGGVVVTDDDAFADRVRMIRNHAEAVAAGDEAPDLVNMVGFNFRLGEIEAAIGLCQLAKGEGLIEARRANVARLEQALRGMPGLAMPHVAPGNRHSYYVHALDFDSAAAGIGRDIFVEAVAAELAPTELRTEEGPLIRAGYVRPLYMLPMFRTQTAYGTVQCPFRCPHYAGVRDYVSGLCPTTEAAEARIICHELIRPPMTGRDLHDVINAFAKVYENLDSLRRAAAARAR